MLEHFSSLLRNNSILKFNQDIFVIKRENDNEFFLASQKDINKFQKLYNTCDIRMHKENFKLNNHHYETKNIKVIFALVIDNDYNYFLCSQDIDLNEICIINLRNVKNNSFNKLIIKTIHDKLINNECIDISYTNEILDFPEYIRNFNTSKILKVSDDEFNFTE